MNYQVHVSLLVFALLVVSINALAGVPHYTYTGTSDETILFIRGDTGEYWTPSEANLQTAINTCDEVWLPTGTIEIADVIDLDNGTTLHGGGNATILKLPAPNTNKDIININSKNVLVENIAFDMNYQDSYGNNAIDIKDNGANVTIRNCYFYHGNGTYIHAEDGSDRVFVENCRSYYMLMNNGFNSGFAAFLWNRGENGSARNNLVDSCWSSGFTFESWNTKDKSENHVIEGNIMWGRCAGGVWIEGDKGENITVYANIIHDFSNSTAYLDETNFYNRGIVFADGCVVANNLIFDVEEMGITGRGNSSVTGNQVLKVQDLNAVGAAGAGIRNTDPGEVITVGNIIRGHDISYGIKGGSIVAYNDIWHVDEGGLFEEMGFTDGSFDTYNVITGNKFFNCQSAVACINSQKATVTGNMAWELDYSFMQERFHNCTVSFNFANAVSVYMIVKLIDAHNNTIIGNRLYGSARCIEETGSANNNTILGNNCVGLSNGIREIGVGTIQAHNLETP